ncbi:50S ribosomal protein L24 [Candidatus Acetothermia bacterium]|nr:50S ribosomal protein L24 [Candidatus Acetothermia bacterium]MCI2431147.1 50S ribosomal protein L24 [Candidatus Acetothermia bacterium]MCI2436037.1 50S ribosomal protein L24 [Candidatus Acetothermia bacterium]
MMNKIRKGDTVRVVAGNDKGKEGQVLRVLREENRVIVKGVQMITRHLRPSAKHREGGIVQQEGTIHLSNVLLVCPECDRPTRVGFQRAETGEKLRRCKQCGKTFD